MISGLVQILFFQGLGELASEFLLPSIPGPVIGLLLLLGFLALRWRFRSPPPGCGRSEFAGALAKRPILLYNEPLIP